MDELLKNLREQREKTIKQARDLAETAVSEKRDMSGEEQTSFDRMITEVDAIDKRMKDLADATQRDIDIAESFRKLTDKPAEANRGGGAFGTWAREARGGDAFEVPAESRAMTMTGTGPSSVFNQLWEYALAASEILQAGVTLITTDNCNTIPLPVVTGHATASASAAANAPITASDSVLTTVDLPAVKYGFLTLVPSELIADATFDVEGYVARNAGRALGAQVAAAAEAAAIAGFTTSGATAPTASIGAATGAVFADALISLFYSVASPYRVNAAWLGSDPTLAAVRKAKNGAGQYAWENALTAGQPGLVLGKPAYAGVSLPAPTGTAKPLYFGDWSALAVRQAGLRFERSVDYAFGNDQVAFRALVRTGAVVVDPTAVKFLALTAA